MIELKERKREMSVPIKLNHRNRSHNIPLLDSIKTEEDDLGEEPFA